MSYIYNNNDVSINSKNIIIFSGYFDGSCCGPDYTWYKINETLHEIIYSSNNLPCNIEGERNEISVPCSDFISIIEQVVNKKKRNKIKYKKWISKDRQCTYVVSKTENKYYNRLQIHLNISKEQIEMIKIKLVETRMFCINI